MDNALGNPQTVVLLGATSDIGAAIAERLLTPATRRLILAARDPDRIDTARYEVQGGGAELVRVAFDAAATDTHIAFVDQLVERYGDLDVVIVAFGVLGDPAELARDATAAVAVAHVNYTGTVSIMTAVAERFRRQGHGRMMLLSSVAGERVRKDMYVYGSTKAGIDAFAQGLNDHLAGSGASVLIVRPGFVHSKMTAGRKPAPLATTIDVVADAAVDGLRAGKRVVWAPGVLRYAFIILRHLPNFVWRRMKA